MLQEQECWTEQKKECIIEEVEIHRVHLYCPMLQEQECWTEQKNECIIEEGEECWTEEVEKCNSHPECSSHLVEKCSTMFRVMVYRYFLLQISFF
jgi:vacuolar-type H+-ATPase subunit H